jgi:hypothetical protein
MTKRYATITRRGPLDSSILLAGAMSHASDR